MLGVYHWWSVPRSRSYHRISPPFSSCTSQVPPEYVSGIPLKFRIILISNSHCKMIHKYTPITVPIPGVHLHPAYVLANGCLKLPTVIAQKKVLVPNIEIKYSQPNSVLLNISAKIKYAYEKSRIHNIVPVLILIAYSILGGFIFFIIESPEEKVQLNEKGQFINRQISTILAMILNIENESREIRARHDSTVLVNRQLRKYKAAALHQLHEAVTWYAFSVYYLTDHESHGNTLLNPANPEPQWLSHFTDRYGRIIALKNYTDQLSERCWEIALEMNLNIDVTRTKLDESLRLFNELTGLCNVLTPTWTFWNSMLLAVTTYTTIGYGNITARSKYGKLAAMIYAVVGIPLMLMILHKLGHQFLRILEYFWNSIIRLTEFLSCLTCNVRSKRGSKRSKEKDPSVPLFLAVGVALGWTFLCAEIFLIFEKNWDYFTSFYFFFCSLTTIGYGDVVPTKSQDIFVIFGLIIVGLSLVSMCINVVQLKLEKLFEELLLMMIEEYRESGVESEEIKGEMGILEIWRMWRKKRRQRKEQKKPKISLNSLSSLRYLTKSRKVMFEEAKKKGKMVSELSMHME
ncbi:hypothetical protein AB6A40_001923 [Gnathostoma spinigerum]|uniref:Potassium channel domain-containing protein n=1 Tax=Gnathostoma spinigerum TaxID=75299 RepID=A0ABD6ED10_9BILA